MENIESTILVPWDFSSSSIFALKHAVNVAKIRHLSITILHIIKADKDETKYLENLKRVANENQDKTGIKTNALIQKGNLYKCIRQLAALPNTVLVVMKTDGVRGSQKYFGSRAIKMMLGSKIPFIVVQEPPLHETFENIVLPIDYRTENKELVSYLLNLSKYYSSKLHILKIFTKDPFYKKNIANNINFAKSMFEGKQIPFEIINVPGKENEAKEITFYAKQINADLILIQLHRNLTATNFLFGVKEQRIIANEYKIPVMCLNPKELTIYTGFR